MEDIRGNILDTGVEEVMLNRGDVSKATKECDTRSKHKTLPQHRLRKEADGIGIIDSTHDYFVKICFHTLLITTIDSKRLQECFCFPVATFFAESFFGAVDASFDSTDVLCRLCGNVFLAPVFEVVEAKHVRQMFR